MKQLTIRKQRLLEWYFESGQDSENEELRLNLADIIVSQLFASGKAVFTVEDIFEMCNKDAIRAYFTEEFAYQTDDYDVELSDLEFEYKIDLI
jgi:hypothetical protein